MAAGVETPNTSTSAGESTVARSGSNSVKEPEPVTLENVLLALQETEEERELRLRGLFGFFDSNNVGYLDSVGIEKGLSAMLIPADYKFAKELLDVCDANHDGRVDYQEFRKYMDDKELELYMIFQAIDVEHNGSIQPEELWDALVKAGIELDDDQLAHFVEHVDKDNDGIITFEEWRDFLLLYPHEVTMENIYRCWERLYLVDIGEQAVIPQVSKHVNATKYLIAGGVAGTASRTLTAPLDRLKVVLQVQTSSASIGSGIRGIWNQGGFLGFYRGNGINVLKVGPESAVKFYTFEMLKSVFVDGDGDTGTIGLLCAGGLAGAVAQTAIYPMDLVKIRLQTHVCESRGVPSLGKLTKDILVQEGPRALYKGLVPSLLGIIPYAGIDLAAYDTLKVISKKYILHNEEPGPLTQISCGAVSGALGATCVYPLQVVRTRMQAERGKSSMHDMFGRTYKHEGVRGFYKGLFPNLLKVVPAASITYLVYEAMKKSPNLS